MDIDQIPQIQHPQSASATITWADASAYHEPTEFTISDVDDKSYHDVLSLIIGTFHVIEHGLKIKRIVLHSKIKERLPKSISWGTMQEFAMAKNGPVRLSIETERRGPEDAAVERVGEGLAGISVADG